MPYFNAALVGMHFRPPAKDVVKNLPAGAELLVQRQPENPHDSDACQVLLYGFCDGGQHSVLYHQLIDQQADPDIRASYTDPLHLGYIAAKTGHAQQIAAAMDAAPLTSVPGKLAFGMAGQPMVEIEWGDVGQKSEEDPLVEEMALVDQLANDSKFTLHIEAGQFPIADRLAKKNIIELYPEADGRKRAILKPEYRKPIVDDPTAIEDKR